MLSRFDDYPIHQTAEPIARTASTDRNVYDRYWLNGYADDGDFYFGVALGTYPNRGIMDCGFSIVRDGEQHAFHGSRRAPAEPTDTRVGPFRIEVIEPMRRLRVVLEPNETGIACDLEFRARTACIEEGRQTLRNGHKLVMDATRFAQFGVWQGQFECDGREVAVTPERVRGTKDRSWGTRLVGEPEVGGAPSLSLPQVFFLWAPLHWDGYCSHFGLFQDGTGHTWHRDGAIAPAYRDVGEIPGTVDEGLRRFDDVEHRIEYEPGTRRARSATIVLVGRSGERKEIHLEPLLCFRMKGIGYTHPVWGHGRWHDELAIGGERWKCDEIDEGALENFHVQQVMRARCGDEEGIGVLEQLCIGPHAPSGFTEFVDTA